MLTRLISSSFTGIRPLVTSQALRSPTFRALSTALPSVSIVNHPHKLTPHPATEYLPAEDDRLFAIISLMGKQHKITKVCLIVSQTSSTQNYVHKLPYL